MQANRPPGRKPATLVVEDTRECMKRKNSFSKGIWIRLFRDLVLGRLGRDSGAWVSAAAEAMNDRWNPRAFARETRSFDESQTRRRNAADRMKGAGSREEKSALF